MFIDYWRWWMINNGWWRWLMVIEKNFNSNGNFAEVQALRKDRPFSFSLCSLVAKRHEEMWPSEKINKKYINILHFCLEYGWWVRGHSMTVIIFLPKTAHCEYARHESKWYIVGWFILKRFVWTLISFVTCYIQSFSFALLVELIHFSLEVTWQKQCKDFPVLIASSPGRQNVFWRLAFLE